jgi:hypothetical protein
VEYGKPKKVNCVFQIWVKKDEPRALHPVESYDKNVKISPYFQIVKTAQEADFIIGCQKQTGMVLLKTAEMKRRQSGYYIKVNSHRLRIYLALMHDYNMQLVPCEEREFIACPFISKGELKFSIWKLMTTKQVTSTIKDICTHGALSKKIEKS